MKSISTLIAISILTLCSISCSATGPEFIEIESSLPPIPEGMGRIFFYNAPTALNASDVFSPDMILDDHKVGEMQTKAFFYADCTVGEHIAALDPVGVGGKVFIGIFSPESLWQLPKSLRVKLQIKEGGVSYVAYRMKGGNSRFLTLNNAEQGYTDLMTCVYTGPLPQAFEASGGKK